MKHHSYAPVPGIRVYARGGPVATARRVAGETTSEKAYVLEWTEDDDEPKRRRLDSAEELRAAIEGKGETRQRARGPLLVVHGLPTDYLVVLRDLLDIDPRFIDAHVRRQSYRPLGRRHSGAAGTTFAHFDYPELVGRSRELVMSHVSKVDDLMGDPIVSPLSRFGDDAAMFCRASLWCSSTLDVLLLDRPLWSDPSLGIYKMQHSTRVVKCAPSLRNPWGMELTGGSDIPSLETWLTDYSFTGPQLVSSDILGRLEAIVLGQWAEFFEALAPETPPSPDESTALYWQVHQCLERNLATARLLQKQTAPGQPASSDWEWLLARLGRQTQIVGRLTPAVTSVEMPSRAGRSAQAARDSAGADEDDARRRDEPSPPQTDENQRSLDRVTYLGGVLLPISVVSGILSMNDDFSPGGDMFFVFWATTMPLCLITLLVIYADSIRKMEVWIEVATSSAGSDDVGLYATQHVYDSSSGSGSSSSSSSNGGGGGSGGGNALPDIEEAVLSSAAVAPIAVPIAASSRERSRQRRRDECVGMPGPPEIIAENSFSSSATKSWGEKKWKKQQLGWVGACKSILRIYRLKQLQGQVPGPPRLPPIARRGDTRSI